MILTSSFITQKYRNTPVAQMTKVTHLPDLHINR